MLGAIIGDIVGSRFEFDNHLSKDFELFHDECDFTDDTICTIAIADAVLSHSGFRSSLIKWCRKYPNPKGAYGCSFSQWIMSKNPTPYGSFGNGSAMRVSPIGWISNDERFVATAAILTAAPTHNHPEGIKGAVSVSEAIVCARKAEDKKEAVKKVALKHYPHYLSDFYLKGRFDETCQGTVPLCFKIIEDSTSFEDAIRTAISYGGDSDTIGAIVGGIAESVWGIPQDIRDKALMYLPREMKNIVKSFYDTYIEKEYDKY